MSVTQLNPEEVAQLGVDVLPRLMRSLALAAGHGDEPGVGATQFRVLKSLAQRPWLVSELAHALQVSVPTVSVAVDSLVRRGLVERAESVHDRRAIVLTLTESGSRSHEAFQQRAHAALLQIVQRLSTEDQAALAAALSAVAKALEETRSGPEGGPLVRCLGAE